MKHSGIIGYSIGEPTATFTALVREQPTVFGDLKAKQTAPLIRNNNPHTSRRGEDNRTTIKSHIQNT